MQRLIKWSTIILILYCNARSCIRNRGYIMTSNNIIINRITAGRYVLFLWVPLSYFILNNNLQAYHWVDYSKINKQTDGQSQKFLLWEIWYVLIRQKMADIQTHSLLARIFMELYSTSCTFGSKSGTKSFVRRYQAKFAITVPKHLKVCHIWLHRIQKHNYIFYSHN